MHKSGQIPETPQQHYDMGDKFIRCSAFFRMGAEASRANGLSETANTFEDNERGWRLVGIFILVDGLTADKQPKVEQTAQFISDAELQHLKSKIELDTANGVRNVGELMVADFTRKCEPLRPFQQAFIDVMRGAKTQ